MGAWTPSEKQPLPELYRRFVGGLGDAVTTDLATVSMTSKPLDLVCRPPLPRNVRLYVFNCTDHPSERKAGDYRIQLRLPGQQKRQRAQLALDSGFLVLLAGYVAEFDVFVLWNATAHADFPYSKGVQRRWSGDRTVDLPTMTGATASVWASAGPGWTRPWRCAH